MATVDQDYANKYQNAIDTKNINIKHGGIFGKITIPTHSERVFLEVWPNHSIEVLVYSQPQPDADENDRIHLIITDDDGRRGWLMNGEDASAVLNGVAMGLAKLDRMGISYTPNKNNPGD